MKFLIDRLYDSVAEKGHVCVGLDTDIAYIPEDYLNSYPTRCAATLSFNRAIIDATADIAAAYKVQIAYYEALGIDGLKAYAGTLAYIRAKGAIAIADIKRGDIAKTAEMYAKAHFSGDFEADFITVNPYMGLDTLKPFYPYIENVNKGIFVLAATSNPGASDIEGVIAEDGLSVSEKVGGMLAKENNAFLGKCGYGAIGAVVGCTHKEQTARMRARMKDVFFLIPGYGAQGGTATDIKACLLGGNGGIVNSSRAILLAYKTPEYEHMTFYDAARAETLKMREDIRRAL